MAGWRRWAEGVGDGGGGEGVGVGPGGHGILGLGRGTVAERVRGRGRRGGVGENGVEGRGVKADRDAPSEEVRGLAPRRDLINQD